ncbi:hypothetical protein AB1Y20_009466 [Prymnesium parvum]|uniref:Uncharacterized protein n=1 Tax=Prymnesium parvum TaxID=97485 RepID=A0AB34K4U6_PRYPA
MRLLALLLALAAPRPLDAVCRDYCVSSCCGFSHPANECSSCDESYECNPRAKCYSEPSERSAASSAGSSERPCAEICATGAVGCCTFSQPAKECSGCPSSTDGCHPGAECYHEGEPGTIKLMRSKGAPSSLEEEPLQETPPSEQEPTRQRTKHEHSPRPRPQGRHQHTPTPASGTHEHTPQSKRREAGSKHVHTPQSTSERATSPEVDVEPKREL